MATRARKFVALVFASALLGAFFGAPLAQAADKKCSPGQHGNPHPGFKPGVCDN